MSVRSIACLCVLTVAAGIAWGAKQCQDAQFTFPSVDADGNASAENDGAGQGKACFNTKKGTLTAKGSGQTTNDSNAKHTFKDDPTVNEYYAGDFESLTKTRLKVSASGSCKVLLKGLALE